MQHNKRRSFITKWSSWRLLWLLGLFVAIAAAGMLVSQQLLLDNARTMGKNLVTSYSTDENRTLREYEKTINMGMAYLDDFFSLDVNAVDLDYWLIDFFGKSIGSTPSGNLDACAVINGKVVATDPAISALSPEELSWYSTALAAEGEVIFTNAYLCPVHNKMTVTAAAADPSSGTAMAVDLSLEYLRSSHVEEDLPAGGAYYVLDSQGSLLYYKIPFEAAEEDLQAYTKNLFDRVNQGELDGKNNEIIGMQHLTRGLYYQRAENGWLCILTVPYETLLQGVQSILVWYGAGLIFFLLIAMGMWLRDRRLSKAARSSNETLQVMGNIYYAFYRINMVTGTYELTKPSGYVLERIKSYTGDYNQLLEVITSALDDWTGEDFSKNFSLENIRRLAEQQTRDFGGEFLRRFGDEERWISVRLLIDPEIMPNEAVICFRDIENEKEEQQQQVYLMKGALAAAEQSERSQKQFFSVMSHDMRTPLNIIIGMTNLALQAGGDLEKIQDYLNKIGGASQQLLALINDILEISRLEQGNISMEIKSFNLSEAMQTWSSPFQAQAQAAGKTFRLSMDIKDIMIKGDPARLGQIINNLVSNAMKFTHSGDQISVALRQMDEGRRNNYLFVVEDTGPGMSEEFLPKLFDPYEREIRFGAKDVMGTGLGMPIVKNLVTRMGGQITVNSTLGKGTVFSVTLPFDVGDAPQAVPEADATPATQLENRHILLAEDNFLNMEIATELLQMRGAQVTPAENGREALEAFQNAPPFFFDAILMDMQMPEMDGCQASEAIRALDRPDAKIVPIVALTANAFAEDISRTAQAGMDAHLAKPINIEQLCATLLKLISQRGRKSDSTPTEGE